MDPILEHHYHNIAHGKTVENKDGTLSTVKTRILEINGVETIIPTVWDGKIVDDKTAIDNALASGVNWDTAYGDNAVKTLEDLDKELHERKGEDGKLLMNDTTTPEAAKKILGDYYSQIHDEDTTSIGEMGMGIGKAAAAGLMLGAEKLGFDTNRLINWYVGGDSYDGDGYSKGGLLAPLSKEDAMKGRSEQDKEIADEKTQVDPSEADTDKNGYVDGGERELAKAKDKGELLDEDDMPVKMNHGGMACGCEGACDGSCGMSGYDEVSGNPIPVGSSAENVRDDIDAKLSEDEYVLPAHVVKWHGLRHIMDLQAEAEMGLMSMKMDGLIQDGQEEPYGEGIENATVSDEGDTEQEEGAEETEAPEVATVKVDDHLDDDEDKEISPKSKPLPAIMKRQKVVFAI